MATQLLTSSGGLSGQYQKYFDKKLLTAVLQKLVMSQFPQTRKLPPGMGALTVRFTRPMAPDRSTVSALTEGTPLASDSDYSLTFIDATCTQVGQKTTISDILGETNLFDTLELVSTWMGQNAALYYDFAITTEYQSGVNATNKQYGNGTADWTTLAALSNAADGRLTITDILRACTRLTAARAPKVSANGKGAGSDYVAIVAPQPGFEIRKDTDFFIGAGIRGNNEGLFNGEFGSWYGVKLIEATNPWREATGGAEGTYSSTGGIYATIVTGGEAVGMVDLASQGITSPKLIVKAGPDKTDQLNQFTSVGWKSFFKVKTLKDDWSVIIRSLTTYS
jgi:N4-gp56 family major capsid protein